MMEFESKIFDEPELEFGDKHHHPDPRLGLVEAGPLQPPLGEVIKIGVVGSAKTVEDTEKFLAAVAVGFEGKSDKHPNLHPDFPGLGNANPFNCRFEIEAGGQQLFTSAAQMFDERGRGFILKGKRAQTESRGRHPYMTFNDSYDLISQALSQYKNHHKHFPARVIVLKTSRFREEEAEGVLKAYSVFALVGTWLRCRCVSYISRNQTRKSSTLVLMQFIQIRLPSSTKIKSILYRRQIV